MSFTDLELPNSIALSPAVWSVRWTAKDYCWQLVQ